MQILVAIIILSWFLIGFLAWLLYVFVRQHGRALLSQEGIEQRMGQIEETLSRLADLAANPSAVALPQPQAAQPPQGLPIGTPAPEFTLKDIRGKMRSLADFAGRPAVFLFFNPDCGFCEQLAPRLREVSGEAPRLVMISRGDAGRHRRLAKQHGWRADILLEPDWEVAGAYGTNGTPTGYLIDAQGRIASTLAVGGDAVLQLTEMMRGDAPHQLSAEDVKAKSTAVVERARAAGLSVRQSTINREGLEPGTPAPLFTLPQVGGEERSLADYRGRRVLLVFSDPACGPCQTLAPSLERLHRSQRQFGLELLMISRGSVEDNEAKVREHQLTFPVLIQNGWQTSKDYGMFATPIGYLLDESGTITRPVAIGADQILNLVS